MVKLTDSKGASESFWCRNCSIEYNPENESIRHKQKLEVPDRNIEPCVSSTPGTDYLAEKIEITHQPELRGSIAELAKRGTIRVTKFEDSSQK